MALYSTIAFAVPLVVPSTRHAALGYRPSPALAVRAWNELLPTIRALLTIAADIPPTT